MATTTKYQLPVWARCVSKLQIRRLYISCGKGITDEELIDDVGFSLYARCESILKVHASVRGRPPCPNCETTVKRKGQPTEVLECMNCGWKCPWQLYQKTYQRKGLNGGGQGFIEEFVEKFKNTYSYSKRFILIDTLIHCFHWSGAGRPGSASLIEGKMKDVMAFLDHLSYGDKIPEDIEKKREEWRKTWQQNPWSKGKGQ